MNKKISIKIADDKEFVLETIKTDMNDFVDAFLGHALFKVKNLISEKKIKNVYHAREVFVDIVDDNLTYFFKNNNDSTKEKVFEWLLESVIGAYAEDFVNRFSQKSFVEK